jgi:hypothetical protein
LEKQGGEVKIPPKKIMLITDFEDNNEAREWREKIKTEASLTDRPAQAPDFQ